MDTWAGCHQLPASRGPGILSLAPGETLMGVVSDTVSSAPTPLRAEPPVPDEGTVVQRDLRDSVTHSGSDFGQVP